MVDITILVMSPGQMPLSDLSGVPYALSTLLV